MLTDNQKHEIRGIQADTTRAVYRVALREARKVRDIHGEKEGMIYMDHLLEFIQHLTNGELDAHRDYKTS